MSDLKNIILGDEPVQIIHTVDIPNKTILAAAIIGFILVLPRLVKK